VLGEKDDEIGRREVLEIRFEVLPVGGVEEDFTVEALEAYFAKRDRRADVPGIRRGSLASLSFHLAARIILIEVYPHLVYPHFSFAS
jgi:hypothetical protein